MNKEIEFIGHRERLNKVTPISGDAIVRSHRNKNYEKLAEMTSSLLKNKVTICVGNLAAQFVILKFGSVVAKGAGYCHSVVRSTR